MEISELPDKFKTGYRGILLLFRSKDGEIGNAQRKCVKSISNSVEEWNETVRRYKQLQDTLYPTHRIYSSVNPRDISSAIRLFKKRQLDADFGSIESLHEFYEDIDNRFFSCMMNPSCRLESNFLIDCDSSEDYVNAISEIPKNLILLDYPTKNGRHLITKPFNPNEFQVNVKKDDLIFIC